jgi:hypothetical protein
LTLALLPACAYAVDGVTLINQSTVMAAGGFPYKITQPGSYKLTGNLSVPNFVSGLQIAVSNVTLDLNGFTISGAQQPFLPPFTALIEAIANVQGLAIRNGTLLGTDVTNLINLRSATGSILEELLMFDVGGGNSSDFGTAAVVRHINNPSGTITVTCPAMVAESLAFIFGEIKITSTACTLSSVSGTIL